MGGRVVNFMGLSGKGVRDVTHTVSNMPWGLYSAIVLSVGGNDLSKSSRSPVTVDVANDLRALAQKLVAAGNRKVIICQLLHRASESHFRGIRLAEYNRRVYLYNAILRETCCGPQIFFWQHHHNVLGSNRLAADGVHGIVIQKVLEGTDNTNLQHVSSENWCSSLQIPARTAHS